MRSVRQHKARECSGGTIAALVERPQQRTETIKSYAQPLLPADINTLCHRGLAELSHYQHTHTYVKEAAGGRIEHNAAKRPHVRAAL